MRSPSGRPWWRDAVVYEIYVRSYADASGDGIGDLDGITAHLNHAAELGVDAVWLTPFYPSPQADGGYDVADYRDVDPVYGDLAGFDRLLGGAHERGLRVLVDLVPNHTSERHPWFRRALADGPGSPARARYLFRDGRGRDGSRPPNNWQSTFGGPAWTRVPDGQWYLHLFAPAQPDLDWTDPDVLADFDRTLQFWFDRGVDGFRVDVAMGLVKGAALADLPDGAQPDLLAEVYQASDMWNQPGVHEIYRRWRALADRYPGDRMLVGEVWLGDPREVARYVRPDELSLAFNFRLLHASWSAAAMRAAIEASLSELDAVGATSTWVLSNHDVARHVSRYGGGAVGQRRARAAALLLLALPGSAFVYAGEELGLPDVSLPDAALRDPIWARSAHRERGRDGGRVPLPWSGASAPYGFCPDGAVPWLPMPEGWGPFSVAAQRDDPASTLSLYRSALRLRREQAALGDGPLGFRPSGDDMLCFTRPHPAGDLTCVLNAGRRPVPLPPGRVLLASMKDAVAGNGTLAPDAAVWLGAGSP